MNSTNPISIGSLLASQEKSPALEVLGLSKNYGTKKALDSLSFEVKSCEIVALVGESGSGKSTALQIIAGLQEADSGQVRIQGRTVFDESISVDPALRHVGMVFQDTALFPHLTVEDNILFGMSKQEKNRKGYAKSLLELFSLPDLGKRYPHELSGGQQQRIGIARALAAKPRVLLMDEPFSSLDRSRKRELLPELRRILKQSCTSSLVVSHDEEEALALADRIIVIHQGGKVSDGIPEDLYRQPRLVPVAEYFGMINLIPLRKCEQCPEGWQIETHLGQTVLPKASWTSQGLPKYLGLRAESLAVSDQVAAAGGHACRLLEQRFALPHSLAVVCVDDAHPAHRILYAQSDAKMASTKLVVQADLSQGILLGE